AKAGVTALSSSVDSNNRILNLTVGTLTGPGTISVSSNSEDNRPIRLTVIDATAFSGEFNFDHGIVDFENDIGSGGSLSLSGTSRIVLDQALTFSSVSINGAVLAEGTHTFAQLNAA